MPRGPQWRCSTPQAVFDEMDELRTSCRIMRMVPMPQLVDPSEPKDSKGYEPRISPPSLQPCLAPP